MILPAGAQQRAPTYAKSVERIPNIGSPRIGSPAEFKANPELAL